MKKNNYGNHAESFVCSYLENNGYKIITRNFKSKCGEIDIIAVKDDYICFVEIKYRTGGYGLETAINRKKQWRIMRSAEEFIIKTGCSLQPRFDAAFVSGNNIGNGEDMSLEYISNAFDMSDI